MAKKRRSRFDCWLDKQDEDSVLFRILYRMLYSDDVGDLLKEEHPILFFFVMTLLGIILMLPMIIHAIVLEWHGIETLSGLRLIPGIVGHFAALFTGIGAVNLSMPLIELLCLRILRKQFPNGFDTSFYLGHIVTLIFFVGCGGLTALCAWLTCCVVK